MKINWGTGIVIAFILFAAMLTYYMVRGIQNPSELVAEDYYEQEIRYQVLIDQKSNASQLQPLVIEKNKGFLEVHYPADLNINNAKGTLDFYRPNDKNLDIKLPVKAQDGVQSIPLKNLVKGRWTLKIYIDDGHKKYFWERKLSI